MVIEDLGDLNLLRAIDCLTELVVVDEGDTRAAGTDDVAFRKHAEQFFVFVGHHVQQVVRIRNPAFDDVDAIFAGEALDLGVESWRRQ